MGREVHAVGFRGNIREAEMEVSILGQRQVTPRWEDDLVQDLEMLVRRRTTPRWLEDLVRFLSRVLEY